MPSALFRGARGKDIQPSLSLPLFLLLSASFYRPFLRYHFGGKYPLKVLTPSRAFIAYAH